MKNHIYLSIPNPCSEKWENLSTTQQGGFCNQCCKEVIDFTKMTDEEIIQYFAKAPVNTCGRLRKDQLHLYTIPNSTSVRPGFMLLKAGILSLAFMIFSKPSQAQTLPVKPIVEVNDQHNQSVQLSNPVINSFTVKGTVVSAEDSSALPGVNVWLRNTTYGTVTDADGKFEFPEKLKAGDVLVFSFIGMKSQELTITQSMKNPVEVKMEMSVEIMGEIVVGGVYSERPSALKRAWFRIKDLF